MAKLTFDEKISKWEVKLEKELISLEKTKKNIKFIENEIAKIQSEKDAEYTKSFLEILAENGFTTDKDRADFIKMMSEQFKKDNELKEEIPAPLE